MIRLVLVNPNTSPDITAAMLSVARQSLPPWVNVVGMTAAFGVPLILDKAALATAAKAVLALVPHLLCAAPHGVIVSAFGDPGLWSLRDHLPCPVTGIAEAGMAEAASGGRLFAVVTTTPHLIDDIAATAARYGHAGLFRGTVLTAGDAVTLMTDPRRLVAALESACRVAIEERGAAALLIGGGPLATAARALAGAFPVPLIEPVPAALRLALRRAGEDRLMVQQR